MLSVEIDRVSGMHRLCIFLKPSRNFKRKCLQNIIALWHEQNINNQQACDDKTFSYIEMGFWNREFLPFEMYEFGYYYSGIYVGSKTKMWWEFQFV